jgi:hypothetical protein
MRTASRAGMDRFITYVLEEFKVIRHALFVFVAALLVITGLLFYGIWQAFDWRYSGIIDNLKSDRDSARYQRDEYKDKLQGATPDQAKARMDDLEARLRLLEPRALSADQRIQIAKSVQVPPGSFYVMVIAADMDCTDCYQYAVDFQAILSDANWRHGMIRVMARQAASPKGVAILTPDPSAPLPEAVAVADGLRAAGIPFDLTKGAELDPNGRGKWVAGLLITPKAGAYSSAGKR